MIIINDRNLLCQVVSRTHMLVLWIPIPQKMANASRKFSSLLVKGRLSNLLTSCTTPTILRAVFLMGMHRMDLWRKPVFSSTDLSNLGSWYASAMHTVCSGRKKTIRFFILQQDKITLRNKKRVLPNHKKIFNIRSKRLQMITKLDQANCQLKSHQWVEWGTERDSTSPVVAACPVMPMLIGKRDSKGLVRLSASSPCRSFTSKSNTRENVPRDASCTKRIWKHMTKWVKYVFVRYDYYIMVYS